MKFEMLKEKSSIIKVIGVGGGGGNAVNHMYRQGIAGVDFIICNTDAQALELSPIPNKVQLGASLTEGMGAGSIPEVGKNSAIENIDDIKEMLGNNTRMLFITAGMGGGTGTGASPIIAKAARELDILTVAIITTPFAFEGKRRRMQAEEGLAELKDNVDSYLVISNDHLRDIFGNLTLGSAFGQADDILTTAAKGIAEIITLPGYINVDFKDVRTVMKDSGVAIMGSFAAEGEDRAVKAVKGALSSPLLKDNEIEGASYILLNISSGTKEVTMDEVSIITDFIQEQAGLSADLIWGNCSDENLGDKISVTIIATGFQTKEEREQTRQNVPIKQYLTTDTPLIKPINQLINPSIAAVKLTEVDQPLVKTEAKNQVDLFGQTLSSKIAKTVLPDVLITNDEVIKHQLIADEKVEELEIEEHSTLKFDVKIAPSEFLNPVQEIANKEDITPTPQLANVDNNKPDDSMEEQLRISRERILRLKALSVKLRTTNGLQEMENEPAYKRKQMQMNEVQHSSEPQASRFTLSFDDGQTQIRNNNSFLHDNVD